MSKVSYEKLAEAYNTMAKVIELYGEQYLPIFERLHEEIESVKKKRSLLDIAKKVANDNQEL